MPFSRPPLFSSSLRSLPLISKGKVRDIYAVGSDKLLIVTTDRLSAFDVVLPDPIPLKGRVLTALADFWFRRFSALIPNHLLDIDPESVVTPKERAKVSGRAVVVKRLTPLPIEAIARGYLSGSGWKDYQQSGAVCGVRLPAGLRLASRLPEAIFTPATKAAVGAHDENIPFSMARDICAITMNRILPHPKKITMNRMLPHPEKGADICDEAAKATLAIYREAAEYARTKGVIIADAKFEFGVDKEGTLHLIDEVLTPDSSRFWAMDSYEEGVSPPSFDKQYVRDYLETLDWNKKAPGPALPKEIIARTSEKYREAFERLTGRSLLD
ncbi:MAG: phosphoribosylaminoimidazolesuccinocarboxamide synthase [Zoogloeaceae bacterium]|jgi:phosphoribosylaminoimidazole-succinocarboxamide synthase|nr:phosphoribosylaminoimidazolesuccinocarboxamide synthase [Zoogloeaceae bacterium]